MVKGSTADWEAQAASVRGSCMVCVFYGLARRTVPSRLRWFRVVPLSFRILCLLLCAMAALSQSSCSLSKTVARRRRRKVMLVRLRLLTVHHKRPAPLLLSRFLPEADVRGAVLDYLCCGMTSKELARSKQQSVSDLSPCPQSAAEHEATAAKKEGLCEIAQAKKALQETGSSAMPQTHSIFQVGGSTDSQIRTRRDLAISETAAAVKRLAQQQHSAALVQLASCTAAILRLGRPSGGDPFAKLQGLIVDTTAKLVKETGDRTAEKAHGDEQKSKVEAKKGEFEEGIARTTNRLDRAVIISEQLEEEINILDADLAALAKDQAEMDRFHQGAYVECVIAKSGWELGMSGVRKALGMLRDCYGADSASMLQDASKVDAFMQQPAAAPGTQEEEEAGGMGDPFTMRSGTGDATEKAYSNEQMPTVEATKGEPEEDTTKTTIRLDSGKYLVQPDCVQYTNSDTTEAAVGSASSGLHMTATAEADEINYLMDELSSVRLRLYTFSRPISEHNIEIVRSYAQCSRAIASEALRGNKGDVLAACAELDADLETQVMNSTRGPAHR